MFYRNVRHFLHIPPPKSLDGVTSTMGIYNEVVFKDIVTVPASSKSNPNPNQSSSLGADPKNDLEAAFENIHLDSGAEDNISDAEEYIDLDLGNNKSNRSSSADSDNEDFVLDPTNAETPILSDSALGVLSSVSGPSPISATISAPSMCCLHSIKHQKLNLL